MKIFYGPKGTGKTKAIIDFANEVKDTAKGHVVYITDSDKNAFDIKRPIRFLDTTDFGVKSEDEFRGFIKGIVASNGDNEYVFIDGVARICCKALSEIDSVFETLVMLEEKFGVKFVITCSGFKEDLPDFILKYVD
ncbi:MAG: AAA family ATPase [Clostridia bacterium]|nr:AAA family ATPase [Clostridia bacterium]